MSEFGGLWSSMETPKVTQCALKHVRLKSLQTVEVGTFDSTEEEILVCNLKTWSADYQPVDLMKSLCCSSWSPLESLSATQSGLIHRALCNT